MDKEFKVRNVLDKDKRLVTTYKTIGDDTVVTRRSTGVGASGLFRIVLILLLLVNMMRVAIHSPQTMTFTGFLEVLQRVPSIETGWLKSFQMWGQSLRSIPLIGDALAFTTTIISVAIFGATGIVQIGYFAVYFMRYLFI